MTDHVAVLRRMRNFYASLIPDHPEKVTALDHAIAAVAERDALVAERDEARGLVIEANNSLFGSQGYFHSLNGGAYDKHHLARAIESLKRSSRKRYALVARLGELEKAWRAFADELDQYPPTPATTALVAQQVNACADALARVVKENNDG